MKQFETDSLVESERNRVDPTAPPRNSAGRKPGTTSTLSSVSLDPMPIATARKLVKRLLAGFPNLGAHDPEGYIAALIEVMGAYPEWAGQRTIAKVDEIKTEFPMSDKTLRTWLDDQVRPYRFEAEWKARSAKQIEERQDAPAQPVPQEGRGQIYWNYDEAVAVNGGRPPIGAFEKIGRTVTYRG